MSTATCMHTRILYGWYFDRPGYLECMDCGRRWPRPESEPDPRPEIERLRAELDRMREALRECHEAMQTWFSSEYAEHPIAKRAAAILGPSRSQTPR
jgi:hypothetical protein